MVVLNNQENKTNIPGFVYSLSSVLWENGDEQRKGKGERSCGIRILSRRSLSEGVLTVPEARHQLSAGEKGSRGENSLNDYNLETPTKNFQNHSFLRRLAKKGHNTMEIARNRI